MADVVIIDGDDALRGRLETSLRDAGHVVLAASTAATGDALIRRHSPDLVILECALPDADGTLLCNELRYREQTRHTRVILVSDQTDETHRVIGLARGADDYVTKPFSMRELLLRVQAVLRHARGRAKKDGRMTFGALELDRDAHRVFVNGKEVELTAKELKLLVTLFDRRGKVLTRSQLLSDVWEVANRMETRTVDTHVKRLRAKLSDCGRYIQSVRSVGYRFVEQP